MSPLLCLSTAQQWQIRPDALVDAISHRNRVVKQLFLPQYLLREDLGMDLGSSKVLHKAYAFEI